ncbi:MAG: tetratricopeptide repeat protein [Prevotella sp.]|nr:tetratricopeptide repeat protein [Prevotella sp.]
MMKKGLLLAFFLLIVCARAGADNLREVALGDSCLEQFDLFHALKHYENAFKEVDDAAVRMRLAECYYRRHDYQRCINIVQPLPEDSLDHKTMREIFYCYKSLAQPALQMKWGGKILERYPMDGEIVAETGMAYNLINDSKRAQAICIRYWFRDHGNLAVNRVLADAYFLDHEFDLAKYAYEEQLAVGDTTYLALFNLGVCYERQLSLDKARLIFEQAINISGGSQAGALYHQGTVLNALKEYDKAREYFSKALVLLLPDSVQMFTCYRGIAESDYVKANYGEAIAAFLQAVAYAPRSLTSYYYLGLCYDATNDHRNAVANYQSFLQLASLETTPSDDLKAMTDDVRRRMKR